MHRTLILIITILLAAGTLDAQSLSQLEPIAHGSPAVLYMDANRNIRNSSLDFRIVPHLGSTSIYVQKHNWKGGGDSAQIYVSDSLQGIARIYLTSTETRNTLLANRYYAEVWQTDSLGVTRRIANGQILMSYSTIDAEPIGAVDTTSLSYRIHVADSLAQVALDSASAARQSLLDQVAALSARLDTVGTADRVVIYGQLAALYDSLAAYDTRINGIEVTLDGKQPLLTPAQQARLDSLLAAGVRITITSQGYIRIISVDTTGLNLGDMYANLVAEVQTKLNSDTASITSVLDGIYSRSGGVSVWTDAGNFIYRDGGITLGGTTSPWSQQAGVYIPRNIKQHQDSLSKLGPTQTPVLITDTTKRIATDSLVFVRTAEMLPIAGTGDAAGGWISIGWVEYAVHHWSAGLPSYFRIAADSANGVSIRFVVANMWAFHSDDYNGAEHTISQIAPFAEVQLSATAISAVHVVNNTGSNWSHKLRADPMGTDKSMIGVFCRNNAGGTGFYATVRVYYYYRDPAHRSAVPITIVNY